MVKIVVSRELPVLFARFGSVGGEMVPDPFLVKKKKGTMGERSPLRIVAVG